MEDLDLRRLSSDRDHLSKILRAFVEMQVSIGRMISRDSLLKLFAANDKRKHSTSATINYITSVMEYLGDDDRCYFKPEEVIKLLATKTESRFAVPSYAQPLGWDEELMDKSIKPTDGVSFDPQRLKDVLGYLLRPDFNKLVNEDYFGVIFRNDEMFTTNGQLMLIQNGLPVVTVEPRLLGYDTAVSLYSILRTPYVQSVQMGVAKKSAMFGIRVELDDDAELFFWSKPRYHTLDDYKDPRPAVDPRSVGFVVHSSFLEPILSATMAAVKEREKPVVYLHTTNTGLGYVSYGADETHIDAPRPIYQGEIPMIRSTGSTEDIGIGVRAESLLQAVKGMGDSVQFLIPFHPLLGLQVHPIDSFYVNCSPNQFALVAPFVLDRSMVASMERLKRKANNAME